MDHEPAHRAPQRTESLLTRREQEVAALVAEGLTNQEIADRLVISTRTAEAHVEQDEVGNGRSGDSGPAEHYAAPWSTDQILL